MKHTHAICTLNAELFNVKIIAVVVMDTIIIIIIIIIYDLCAGYLQLYTCNIPCLELYCGYNIRIWYT